MSAPLLAGTNRKSSGAGYWLSGTFPIAGIWCLYPSVRWCLLLFCERVINREDGLLFLELYRFWLFCQYCWQIISILGAVVGTFSIFGVKLWSCVLFSLDDREIDAEFSLLIQWSICIVCLICIAKNIKSKISIIKLRTDVGISTKLAGERTNKYQKSSQTHPTQNQFSLFSIRYFHKT